MGRRVAQRPKDGQTSGDAVTVVRQLGRGAAQRTDERAPPKHRVPLVRRLGRPTAPTRSSTGSHARPRTMTG